MSAWSELQVVMRRIARNAGLQTSAPRKKPKSHAAHRAVAVKKPVRSMKVVERRSQPRKRTTANRPAFPSPVDERDRVAMHVEAAEAFPPGIELEPAEVSLIEPEPVVDEAPRERCVLFDVAPAAPEAVAPPPPRNRSIHLEQLAEFA